MSRNLLRKRLSQFSSRSSNVIIWQISQTTIWVIYFCILLRQWRRFWRHADGERKGHWRIAAGLLFWKWIVMWLGELNDDMWRCREFARALHFTLSSRVYSTRTHDVHLVWTLSRDAVRQQWWFGNAGCTVRIDEVTWWASVPVQTAAVSVTSAWELFDEAFSYLDEHVPTDNQQGSQLQWSCVTDSGLSCALLQPDCDMHKTVHYNSFALLEQVGQQAAPKPAGKEET